MTKMTIYFSGSDMTWEDTALFLNLGAVKRHNLRDIGAPHYYYLFDGPSATSSPEHKPVAHIRFDAKSPDLVTSAPRASWKHLYDLSHGTGMDHTIRAGYRMINLAIKNGVTEFDLVGFSRGGSIALSIGALIKDLEKKLLKPELNKLKFNILAIYPVAGLSRNKSANAYGKISPLVQNCIVGLATNEALPGFEPRDILAKDPAYNVNFHPHIKYVFLPLPEDHLMANLWMKDLIHTYLPKNSALRSPCNERLLIERKLGLTGIQWDSKYGETAAFRMVRYFDSKQAADEKTFPQYQRNIFPEDEKHNIDLKKGIEEFFHRIESQHHKINVGHISLQNDADSELRHRIYKKASGEIIEIGHAHAEFKLLQVTSAKKNQDLFCRTVLHARDRNVKEHLQDYTNYLFVNLLHEAMFQQAYPSLHSFLLHWDLKDLDLAIKEFDSISKTEFSFTKANIEHALIHGIRLKPIETFKSTNIKSLSEVFKIATNREILESKEYINYEAKSSESKTTEKLPSGSAAYAFANILVKSTDKDAKSLFKNYAQKYLQLLDFYQIIYSVYKMNKKPLPREFSDMSKLQYSGVYATHFAPKPKIAESASSASAASFTMAKT